MDYKVFKELIEQLFKTNLDGFVCNNKGDFPYFIKTYEDTSLIVRFAVETGWDKYRVPSICPLIRFEKVENICYPLVVKYGLMVDGALTSTITGTHFNVGPYKIQHFDSPWITTEKDFEDNVALMKGNLEHIVMPFFENYDSLEKCNRHIESLPIIDLSKFIDGHVPFKRLIIKKLCNNPDWIQYGTFIANFYKEQAAKNPQLYKNYDNIAQELMEILIDL